MASEQSRDKVSPGAVWGTSIEENSKVIREYPSEGYKDAEGSGGKATQGAAEGTGEAGGAD